MESSERKQEILKAASECFARFGYEKTTLDDIGKMVGLNKASLYYYYKSKEAIFAEVILLEAEAYLQELHVKIQDIADCREKILTYLRERIRQMKNVLNLHNLSVEAMRQVQPLFQKLYQDVQEKEIDFIHAILQSCIEHGDMIPCDSRRIARSILTIRDAIKLRALQGTDVRFMEMVDYTAIEDEVAFTVALILDGLLKRNE